MKVRDAARQVHAADAFHAGNADRSGRVGTLFANDRFHDQIGLISIPSAYCNSRSPVSVNAKPDLLDRCPVAVAVTGDDHIPPATTNSAQNEKHRARRGNCQTSHEQADEFA